MTTYQSAPLTPEDHKQVLSIYSRHSDFHAHLDWRLLRQWLVHPDLCCYIIRERDAITGLAGATVHHSPAHFGDAPVAWLRFLYVDQPTPDDLIDSLWQSLQAQLKTIGVDDVVAVVTKTWVEHAVTRWNFEQNNAVITLRRNSDALPPRPGGEFSIVSAGHADLEQLTVIDTRAFGPLWRYSLQTIEVALQQAATVTMVHHEHQPVGYQLSTRHAHIAHLARLAVLPEMQGQGFGRALVCEMLHHFAERGVMHVTVNTQADNVRSHALYRSLGFEPTAHQVPLWRCTL